ncbi:hypothetical protein HAX54_050216 [Datura stramonium]|uniref:Receptor-like serine/threonine-protein kinase n=1 Tax=Datura stramonium TaxID=4076 RepID=A0ABS8SW64_DATST|nr:hypothetical protein [Datura stramonium]
MDTTTSRKSNFNDFLPLMAEKLGGDGLIGELCKGFQLLMDRDKGVITFDSLKKNSALLGLQDLTDNDLRDMLKEGDFDGDGALNQMQFCVLMFRLSPELMEQSQFMLEEALQQDPWKFFGLFPIVLVYSVYWRICAVSHSIKQSQSLSDGESLVSEGGTFELGFFSPGSSTHRDLILRDEKGTNSEFHLWQSFDYPSDTLLPGMKLGWDLRTGLNRQLSSWRNLDDPSPGELSNGIELHEFPEAVFWKGSRKYFRGGPWTGERFSGASALRVNPNKSVISRLILNDTASSRQWYVWAEASQAWMLYASVPHDYCDTYDLCGANGVCVISDSPVCQCLEGFKPKSPHSFNSTDWSEGCILSKPFSCQSKEVFVKFSGLKLPDTTKSWVPNGVQDLYIRIEASKQAGRRVVNAVLISLITAALLFGLVLFCYDLSLRKTKIRGISGQDDRASEGPKEDLELPFFDLATMANATYNFSLNNKLGEGGFGPVYKGTLVDGQEIAVKRLSKSSGEGLNEFKNEVKLIVKLQHQNLVKLVGSCIDGEEKMLIYEYMANGSLDTIVFDQTKRRQLGWSKFFQIINGIARGLLYLHPDSRLQIIHRDLKASNVLLDAELNPKISDFGLARTFQGDQCGDNTERVVGTFGYMAPEYLLYGLFSVKSDVFSFSLLLLEIVSGKKNRCFRHPQHHHRLIGYAWRMWTEGTPLAIVDISLEDTSSMLEISRCIHVSLLCVQQSPEDRPNMSAVVLMLNGENTLPQPKQPGFLRDVIPTEITSIRSEYDSCTANEIIFSSFGAR